MKKTLLLGGPAHDTVMEVKEGRHSVRVIDAQGKSVEYIAHHYILEGCWYAILCFGKPPECTEAREALTRNGLFRVPPGVLPK